MIRIETKLDFKNYLELMFLLTYRKASVIIITIAGLLTVIMAIILSLVEDNGLVGQPLLVGLILLLLFPLVIYIGVKRGYSSNARLQEKIVYEFTDEKIKLIGETFNSEMDWTKLYKVLELKNWVLLYQSGQIANLVPKEPFGERLEEFREMVRRSNVKAKLKK